MSLTKHYLYFGFDSQNMKDVASESVDLVVTSPPYWNLKDYGNPKQIGRYDTVDEYFDKLNNVWRECFRVLKKGGKICINLTNLPIRKTKKQPFRIEPLYHRLVVEIMNLFGDEIIFWGDIIWNKIGNRKSTGGATLMGSYPYPRNGVIINEVEYIGVFKKKGKIKVPIHKSEQDKFTKDEWYKHFDNVWRFGGTSQKIGSAPFPEELPKRLIKMFSFTGDVILDPFLGTGTTTVAAMKLNRNSIGYELGFKTMSGIHYTNLILNRLEKIKANKLVIPIYNTKKYDWVDIYEIRRRKNEKI